MLRSALFKVLTIRYVMADRGRPGEYDISIVVKRTDHPTYDQLKEYIIWSRERVFGLEVTAEQKNTLMILDFKEKNPVVNVGFYAYDKLGQEFGREYSLEEFCERSTV